jgi:hypothetical protein
MQLFGLLGVASLALASLVVGTRLVLLARRHGQLPELFMGLSYLFAGFLSCVATLAAGELRKQGSAGAADVALLSLAAVHAGVLFLALFVWAVFYRASRAGAAAGAAAAAYLALTFAGAAWSQADGSPSPLWSWLALAGRVGVYAWAMAESLRAWSAARRRLRLGLADPLVVNRMLLWGVGIGCVLFLWLHAGYELWVGDVDPESSYPIIAVFGISCAATTWLAFFPPRFYRERFAAGA